MPRLFQRPKLKLTGLPRQKIHDQVRGLIPYPGAYTILNGKRVKILGRPHTGGGVLWNGFKGRQCGIVVAAGDGTYREHYRLPAKNYDCPGISLRESHTTGDNPQLDTEMR